MLGHSTLEMTKHYCAVFNADIAKDYDSVSPLEQFGSTGRIIKRKWAREKLSLILVLYSLIFIAWIMVTRMRERRERFVHPFWYPLPCLPLLHFCANHGNKGSPIWRPPGPFSSSTTAFIIVVRMMETRITAKGCSGLLSPLDGHVIIGISKKKMSLKYVKSNLFRN